MYFTWEPSTSGRVLAPVPTLLATPNRTTGATTGGLPLPKSVNPPKLSRGNHGGIAPTQIGESPQPHNRGNHGGIAPTQIGESPQVEMDPLQSPKVCCLEPETLILLWTSE